MMTALAKMRIADILELRAKVRIAVEDEVERLLADPADLSDADIQEEVQLTLERGFGVDEWWCRSEGIDDLVLALIMRHGLEASR